MIREQVGLTYDLSQYPLLTSETTSIIIQLIRLHDAYYRTLGSYFTAEKTHIAIILQD
jgi:hypothetical protein